jgi:cell division protein FtsL
MDYTRTNIMKATHFVALFAALLLTATEFLVMDYDARQRAVQYQAEAASALAARE